MDPTTGRNDEDLDPRSLGPRVLAVVPHPDDEAVALTGLMRAALAAGAEVRVAFMTDGDGYLRAAALHSGRVPTVLGWPLGWVRAEEYAALGDARVREAQASLRAIGLEPSDGLFLAFPDGALTRLSVATSAPVTAVTGRTETREGSWAPGVPFTRDAAGQALRDLVAWLDPTAVAFPHPRDGNADHRALSALVTGALAAADSQAARFAYLVHADPWPYLTDASRGLRPPANMERGRKWRRITLDADSLAAKHAAIEAHATQTAIPDLAFFLRSFARDDEWFELRSGSAPA